MIRLQPISSFGVTFSRRTGSSIAFSICLRPAAANGRDHPALRGHRSGADVHERERRHAIEPLHGGRALGRASSPTPGRRGPSSGSSSRASAGRCRAGRRRAGSPGATWIVLQPVPTIATRLPARSTSWSHCAVWKLGPAKSSMPGDRRERRHESWPQAVIRTSASCVAGARLERSSARGPRRSARGDLGAGAHAVEHALLARDTLDVGLDLVAWRVAPRPVRVRRERELVEVRGDVACDARVACWLPDAADALAALEDRDVVVAGAAQHAPRRRSRRIPRRRSRRSAVRSPSRAQVPGCRSSRCSSDGSLPAGQAAIATRALVGRGAARDGRRRGPRHRARARR